MGKWPHFIGGLSSTVEMALGGFCIALVIGIFMGLFSTSEKKGLRGIARVYVEFFQNTPLMLQTLFLFYAVTFSGIKGFTPLMCGIIALGIYHGAYFSEVFRAGITSIPGGQTEAAYSQGFTYLQAMMYIILPQSIKIILPPLVTQIVALIKNTSCMLLVGGAFDLISVTNAYAVGESTARGAGAAYVFSGCLFFLICFPLSTLAGAWEKKLKSRDNQNTNTPKPKNKILEITDEELDEALAKGVN